MWIVAVGWAYVVILMAATETSVIAGIMTFFGYCVLPLSILFYIAGAGKRRQRRIAASASPPAAPAGADASLPLMTPGFFMPAADSPAHCDNSSCHGGDGGAACHGGVESGFDGGGFDGGGCDAGGGDGGGGGD